MKANGLRVTIAASPDLGAYAEGRIGVHRIRCVLCTHAPCDCPPFGTPAYLELVDRLHGRRAVRDGGEILRESDAVTGQAR